MTAMRLYLRRFFTSWVEEDPNPEPSNLDRADGQRDSLEP